MDDFSFVETVDHFGEGRKSSRRCRRKVRFWLRRAAMLDEAAAAGRPSVMKRLLQSVQDKVRMCCPAGPPADDPPCVCVDDEGDIDEAGPGRDIRKMREPQTVSSGSAELSVHVIQRTESRLVADSSRLPDRSAATLISRSRSGAGVHRYTSPASSANAH